MECEDASRAGDPRAISVRGKGRSLRSVRNRSLLWWGKKKFCCYPGSLLREGEAPGGARTEYI